jgi:hypothetical protein
MAKPERKVLIVRREEDEDDQMVVLNALKENVIPFDIQSDRYLSFKTTSEGIQTMLPLLEKRLWDALEHRAERLRLAVVQGSLRTALIA